MSLWYSRRSGVLAEHWYNYTRRLLPPVVWLVGCVPVRTEFCNLPLQEQRQSCQVRHRASYVCHDRDGKLPIPSSDNEDCHEVAAPTRPIPVTVVADSPGSEGQGGGYHGGAVGGLAARDPRHCVCIYIYVYICRYIHAYHTISYYLMLLCCIAFFHDIMLYAVLLHC